MRLAAGLDAAKGLELCDRAGAGTSAGPMASRTRASLAGDGSAVALASPEEKVSGVGFWVVVIACWTLWRRSGPGQRAGTLAQTRKVSGETSRRIDAVRDSWE